jgi:hypothetical protein
MARTLKFLLTERVINLFGADQVSHCGHQANPELTQFIKLFESLILFGHLSSKLNL